MQVSTCTQGLVSGSTENGLQRLHRCYTSSADVGEHNITSGDTIPQRRLRWRRNSTGHVVIHCANRCVEWRRYKEADTTGSPRIIHRASGLMVWGKPVQPVQPVDLCALRGGVQCHLNCLMKLQLEHGSGARTATLNTLKEGQKRCLADTKGGPFTKRRQ